MYNAFIDSFEQIMSENVAIAISTFTDHETTIHGNDFAFNTTASAVECRDVILIIPTVHSTFHRKSLPKDD